ncbi:hypothetical protein [Marinimicrobium sp. ABcell2]|uniref:hypothetical protein n=1 Tax=Marinimicrobium sp. ABcell2 TaxID=3069751 RepID=UPI0027B02C9D|nr:hypothetical protein [Marinimicrobium sp. ABcell2]MDQ2077625.1 hypothetical protein [Marinimicrobium sp. ABcell2]
MSDEKMTPEQNAEMIAEGYKQMPPAQREAFLAAFKRLQGGDDEHEVVDFLAGELGWSPERVAAAHKQIDEASKH